MLIEAYRSGRIRQAIHNGLREFISLLAFCCMTGEPGILTLLYKGVLGDI
jgi:hypothetical protein